MNSARKVVIDMFWKLTNQNFNIRLVDVKNEKYNGLLASVSFPPSSRAPRVSLAPKTPFSFPFKRLPRRGTHDWLLGISLTKGFIYTPTGHESKLQSNPYFNQATGTKNTWWSWWCFLPKEKKKKTTGKEKFKHDHPCYLKSGVLRPTRKLTPQRKKLNTVSTVFIIIVLQVFHKTITMFSYCGPATNMRQLYA